MSNRIMFFSHKEYTKYKSLAKNGGKDTKIRETYTPTFQERCYNTTRDIRQ